MVSPQAGGGRRALLKAGGSDEAGVFSLFVPSLPLLLLMPSLEETECWKFLLIMCVEGAACRGAGAMGVAEGPGGGVGRAAACPGVGSGLMADAGDAACQPVLSATAALCVGDGSYTAGFQTITLNICKQIKKQNHPVRMETSAFLSLSALSPLHLPSRVSEEVGEGGRLSLQTLPAPSLPGAPPTPRATGRDRYIRSSRPTPQGAGHAQTFEKDFLFSGVLPRFSH